MKKFFTFPRLLAMMTMVLCIVWLGVTAIFSGPTARPHSRSEHATLPSESLRTVSKSSKSDKTSSPSHGSPMDTEEPARIMSAHAEIDQKEFDFGIVEPLQSHRHVFRIHNKGKASLTLRSQGTTCKCLKIEVVDPVIVPDGVGEIIAIWDAKGDQYVFRQTATLVTNDPDQKLIDLKIEGRARLAVAAEPSTILAPRIHPDKKAQAHTTILSQIWDSFTIEQVHSSFEGLQWELKPIDQGLLKKYDSLSGWEITITFPEDLPQGHFSHWLRFTARPDSDPSSSQKIESVEREIPIEGRVLRRIAVYGKDIDDTGTIHAGNLNVHRGYDQRYIVKVHDRLPQLNVTGVHAEPDFLEAKLEPYLESQKPGFYYLTVRISGDGIPGIYRGDNRGNIRLQFDHPRVKSLELGVEFLLSGGMAAVTRLSP